MKKTLLIIALIYTVIFTGRSQQQPSTLQPIDTSGAMPRLEIPEITIVGKKAITLPFARKGELYDVKIYEAPPPDTSLIQQRPSISLPIGSLPRYDEPIVPWHISAGGSLGNFARVNGRAYIDYNAGTWGLYGNGGFGTTNGHRDNSAGSRFDLEANAHSLVSTDNDLLGSFHASGTTRFAHETYGMLGVFDTSLERRRNNFVLDAHLSSVDKEASSLSVGLSTDIWSLSDSRPGLDSHITATSPRLSAAFKSGVSTLRFHAGIIYEGSSLSYQHTVQSPSHMELETGLEWDLRNGWSLEVGGTFHNGSATDGESRSIAAPYGKLRWQLAADRLVTLWVRPEMRLETYGELTLENPYLAREIQMRPERAPVNLGGSFWYNSERFSVELRGSITKSSNKGVTVVDSSGKLQRAFLDASHVMTEASGTIKPTVATTLTFLARLQPAVEDGTTTQLPMIPLAQLGARGEVRLGNPLSLWSSLEYSSKRNVDRTGTQSLGDRVLIDIGVLSTAIPRTSLSLTLSNLFNTSYEWWSGYFAPGRGILLEAKIDLQ